MSSADTYVYDLNSVNDDSHIFLRKDWDKFRPTLRTFVNKDLEILHGPCTSLGEIARKKSKRKSKSVVRERERR